MHFTLQPRRSVPRVPSRTSVVLSWLLQVLALSLVGEISGALHTGLDAASHAGLLAHGDEDCEAGEDHECPPGCPSCHCAHSVVPSAQPRIEHAIKVEHPVRVALGFLPREELPPSGPDQSPLYRPPRPRFVS